MLQDCERSIVEQEIRAKSSDHSFQSNILFHIKELQDKPENLSEYQ